MSREADYLHALQLLEISPKSTEKTDSLLKVNTRILVEKYLREDFNIQYDDVSKIAETVIDIWCTDLESEGHHWTERDLAFEIAELAKKSKGER